MATLILLNNFTHDFSAAGWIFCTVLLWSTVKKPIPSGDCRKIITGMLETILLLMRLSAAGIVIFGIVRALAYKQYEWSAAAGDGQIVLLAVKHIILTFVFAVGVVFYRKARKIIKEQKND